ncbi:MAG TPA: shikimate dehydrogenase [Pyrinomonadaceae bacterium]|jgi:3-dehydroquinate dehydratase/shikimate dehydrogenase|nr:shikimate dehydrogenase [Pyrinomonadaceae bacterium]
MNNGKICVSVCCCSVDDAVGQIEHAHAVADVIEVRFDCLSDEQFNVRDRQKSQSVLQRIFSLNRKSRFISTFRPKEQGGKRVMSDEDRAEFWGSGYDSDWADLEEDVFEESWYWLWDKRICSFHDFSGVPKDLKSIYERLRATKADILKIAARADDVSDALRIWKILEWGSVDSQSTIPVAMGEAGKWTRILGLAHGAYMTYASPEGGGETAPGQISVTDMIETFRVKELDQDTEVYGIIAGDTSYSVSPFMHNAAFRLRELNSVFVPLQTRDLDSFVRKMVAPETREVDLNFKGFSVTNPHKQSVIGHLAGLDEAAREIGAVNTVKIEDGKLFGYNTDAPGFIEPLRRKIPDLKGSRAAIVGAGGAARACIYSLIKEGAEVVVFARDAAKAKILRSEFPIEIEQLPVADGRKPIAFSNFDILVNATPLGTKGDLENETIAAEEQLTSVRLVYDLIYNPAETRLIREATAAGAETLGGLNMLIAQGARQFAIWTGEQAPVEEMTAAVRKRLGQ